MSVKKYIRTDRFKSLSNFSDIHNIQASCFYQENCCSPQIARVQALVLFPRENKCTPSGRRIVQVGTWKNFPTRDLPSLESRTLDNSSGGVEHHLSLCFPQMGAERQVWDGTGLFPTARFLPKTEELSCWSPLSLSQSGNTVGWRIHGKLCPTAPQVFTRPGSLQAGEGMESWGERAASGWNTCMCPLPEIFLVLKSFPK